MQVSGTIRSIYEGARNYPYVTRIKRIFRDNNVADKAYVISFRCKRVKLGVLFLTAGSVLCVRRNVGKNKRTKYYEADKAYCK